MFVYGNLIDVSCVFQQVMARPEMRHLANFADASHQTAKYRQAADAIVANIKNYLQQLLKVKGSRTTISQRAYRTVVAACSGANLVTNTLLRKTSEVLGVHVRNISRGVRDRCALEEEKGSGYVACTRARYRNKMPDQVPVLLSCVTYLFLIIINLTYVPRCG